MAFSNTNALKSYDYRTDDNGVVTAGDVLGTEKAGSLRVFALYDCFILIDPATGVMRVEI